ncbi:unnamed protein product [Allacma fusca]|uniref:Uncharacterized protein n=1 Tax=Allacma fusca TaxID=39272 RepID=A0A8J2LSN4_9HEXA|nr:unnamed protein product [Allacma fusca]
MANSVWCCGVRLWTTVIAWCQIVVTLIESVLLTILLIELILLGPEKLKAQFFQDATDGAVSEFVFNILMLIYQLLMALIGLIFGALLLKGAVNENIKYLKLWLIFAMLTMVYSIIAVGVQGFQARYSKSSVEVIGLIVSAAVTVAFNGLSIYAVQDLIQEIKQTDGHDDQQPLITEEA